MDMSLTTEVMGIFVIFCHIFAKMWLSWQRPLDHWKQKCLLWISRPRKPPVISNHILVISHRNAFICIYSNFCPRIGCHGNDPLSLVYGSVTDKILIAQTILKAKLCIDLSLTTEVMAIFDFLAYFGQHLVAMETCLRPL